MSAPIVKYRTNYRERTIERVEIKREDDNFVWLIFPTYVRKVRQATDHGAFFNDWKAAHVDLLSAIKEEFDEQQRQAANAAKRLEAVRTLVEPESPT